MDTKGILMHIDTPDEIAVTDKPALAADPGSAPGLVFVPAPRTAARGSSFRAGEARDAGLFGFMGEIVNVTSVFPAGHALVVMPATVPVAHALRVADKERPDLLPDAEVDDLAGRLMPQVAHAPLGSAAHLVLRPLQLLPTAGVLLAPAVLLGELPELSAALPLQAADAAPGHDERFACIRGHGSQVDFPQVNGCLNSAGGFLRLLNLHTDVQLEAPVPDERARTGIVGKRDGQDEGRGATAHGQDDAPLFPVDGLGGPLDRIEAFLAPGIFHAHLGMFPAQRTGRRDIREKGVNDLLHGLSVEGELPARGSLQFPLPRPRRMGHSGLLMGLHAAVPYAGRFHLRRFEAKEAGWREVVQAVNANDFHRHLFFLSARKPVRGRVGSELSGVAFAAAHSKGALPLLFVEKVVRRREYNGKCRECYLFTRK